MAGLGSAAVHPCVVWAHPHHRCVASGRINVRHLGRGGLPQRVTVGGKERQLSVPRPTSEERPLPLADAFEGGSQRQYYVTS